MIHLKIKQNDEKETLKPKLTDLEGKKADEIGLNIIFGYDRKINKEDSCSTESQSKGKPFAEEDFENDSENVRSPKIHKDPHPGRIEAEALDQQFKSYNYAEVNDRSHLFLILSAATDYIDLVHFIIYFQNHGGIYSLVPYILFLVIIVFPVSIFEVALAQYSSLPLFSMFNHMAKMLGGIPIVMLITRVLYLTHVALRPKLYSYTYHLIYSLLIDDSNWMHCSHFDGVACYDPSVHCRINEDQVSGLCEPEADPEVAASYKRHYSRIHNLPYFGLSGTQITSFAKIYDESDLLASTFLFFVVLGVAFNFGYKHVARFSPMLVLIPIVSLLPICMMVLENADDDIFENIEMRDDVSKLLHYATYFRAFVEAFNTMRLGQGNLLTFGSKVKFHHNFIKDLISSVLFGVGYRLFFVMTFLPVFYACQMFLYPYNPEPFTELTERIHILEILYSGLPIIIENDGKLYIACVALFFGTINTAIFANGIVTLEILKSCIYNILPRLSYTNSRIVQAISIILFTSLLMLHEWYSIYITFASYHDFSDLKNQFNDGLIGSVFITAVFMMIGVRFVYGEQRLYVNCLTMLRKHEKSYKMFLYFKSYLLISWRLTSYCLIIPFVYCTILVLPHYDSFTFQYAIIVGYPITHAVFLIWRAYLKEENFALLSSSQKWKPVHLADEKEAIAHEKMFGIEQ